MIRDTTTKHRFSVLQARWTIQSMVSYAAPQDAHVTKIIAFYIASTIIATTPMTPAPTIVPVFASRNTLDMTGTRAVCVAVGNVSALAAIPVGVEGVLVVVVVVRHIDPGDFANISVLLACDSIQALPQSV